MQICSDVNRPEGVQLLAALGAEALLVPRATPPETYARWRLVLRAAAVTSTAWVLSTNRPARARGDRGSPVGGPSLAVAPDGTVLEETTAPVVVVTLERSVLEAAREAYPGYLERRPDVFARGWREADDRRRA